MKLLKLNTLTDRKLKYCVSHLLSLISCLIISTFSAPLSAEIIYENFPQDMQLYARDVPTNQAIVTVSGRAQGVATGDEVELRVYRNGSIVATQTQPLDYQNDEANFHIQATILAELADYTFVFYTTSGGTQTIDRTAVNIVAGDVFIIDGQSNALAFRRSGANSASSEEAPFIRSYASGIDGVSVGSNLNWYQGNADASYNTNGNIGQWGAKMARQLMDEYQVPIAVFNGAYAGSSISYHARNNTSPTDLATNYGRLLYRLQQADLADKVRAIIWYQGETDGKNAMTLQSYKDRFYELYEGWMADFPNFEQLYINQIRKSCNGTTYHFARIQEAQRQLAGELSRTKLMTAKGIPLWEDDCHFQYDDGYEAIAERMVQAIKNDLYGENTPHVLPPDIASAEFITPDTLMITSKNPADILVWEAGAEEDFFLVGGSADVTWGRTAGNRLYLAVSGNATYVYGITYFGRSGVGITSPYVKNSEGIGMATFFDFPIGEPIMGITNDNYTNNEDVIFNGDVSYNDFVANNSGWLMSPLVNDVIHGNLSLESDGEFSYTPNENFNGVDSFRYEICSAPRPDFCRQASVQINVNPIDDAPTANDDIFGTVQNNTAAGNILLNDNEVDNDGFSLNAIPIIQPENGNIDLQTSGNFVYTPNTNFYGADGFSYQICDATPAMLCDTAWVTLNVMVDAAGNAKPIANDDTLSMNEDGVKSGNVLSNDEDPNDDDLNVTPSPITLPTNGDAIVNSSGVYHFLPDPNYNGIDSFSYEICDDGFPSLCDTAWVRIDIIPVNDAPFAENDTIYSDGVLPSSVNILDNDFDADGDALSIIPIDGFGSLNGELVIQNSGVVNYQPNPGFFGTEQFAYKVCDTAIPAACDEATVTIVVESNCLYIDIQAFMEGTLDADTQEMGLMLNQRGLLPGQNPVSSLVDPTPAGQPYGIAPWNYTGQEGVNWLDDDYAVDMVDWVLVSFRLSQDTTSEIAQTAAVIRTDGTIYLPNRCVLTTDVTDPVYVVIEHRNHMGVMSPQPVQIINQVLSYDFRIADSYRDASGYGQKELATGVWAMIAGDGEQTTDTFSYDVNGEDKQIWFDQNGNFDAYLPGDYNLDGDANGADKLLWENNNGISSRVPK